ncbi:MAG: tetratricopeptide repeat protein [Gemmatimonadaceae bacterium]
MNGFWKDTNVEGLALAKEGRWPDATRAFEDALAQLDAENEQGGVTALAHDDLRAQLLLNIGQCYFHTRDFAEARRLAERSCAIRVSLYGEDALVVARTRGDLAVILGAAGHPDEAMSLLERAVSAVERKRGDESEHLVPLLTNAARLLERSAPDLARPYVSRLNALLFARRLADNASRITPTEMPSHSFGSDPLATASDDHFLRSAIAETVDLLRTTPTANIAMSDRAVMNAEEPQSLPGEVSDAIVLIPEEAIDEPIAPIREEAVSEPITLFRDDAADEFVAFVPDDDIDDTIFDLVEPPPATLNALPQSQSAPANPLGFEVQYGIPEQLHAPLDVPAPTSTGELAQPRVTRSGIRAVGGVRRGSTQVMAPKRLWYIGLALAAFGAGIGLTYLVMPLLR